MGRVPVSDNRKVVNRVFTVVGAPRPAGAGEGRLHPGIPGFRNGVGVHVVAQGKKVPAHAGGAVFGMQGVCM